MNISTSDYDRRLALAIAKSVYQFTRQSTLEQTVANVGSTAFQENQWLHLARFGVTKEEVTFIEGDGESGTAGKHRIKFHQLFAAVSADKVGILLVARLDRLGRNAEDSEKLYNAMATTRCLLMVDGKVFDPSNPSDRLMIGLLGQFAEFENRSRASWMQNARLMLAKERKALIRLPAGMVWGSPDDAAFVQRMTDEGLGSWLAPFHDGTSAVYDIHVSRNERRLYPFPYPNHDVYRTVQLRLSWLLRVRSLPRVLQWIRTAPEWPVTHLGHVPITDGRRWMPNSTVRWRPVCRDHLRKWFLSRSLYGIYAFSSSTASSLSEVRAFAQAEVA